MTERIKLSTGPEVTLVSAHLHPHPEIRWLNAVRMGVTAPDAQRRFELSTQNMADSLIGQITALGISFDAIIMVPSSRQDGKPFFDALFKTFPTKNLTPRFTRKNVAKAMKGGTTLQQVLDDYLYCTAADEKSIHSLLIVDDSFAQGLSVSAVLHHLRTAGLPPDCRVVVAVAGRFKAAPGPSGTPYMA